MKWRLYDDDISFQSQEKHRSLKVLPLCIQSKAFAEFHATTSIKLVSHSTEVFDKIIIVEEVSYRKKQLKKAVEFR